MLIKSNYGSIVGSSVVCGCLVAFSGFASRLEVAVQSQVKEHLKVRVEHDPAKSIVSDCRRTVILEPSIVALGSTTSSILEQDSTLYSIRLNIQ